MNGLNRILVVSMCTRHCLKAVHWGVSLAKNYNAQLFVIHVMHNPFGLEGWNLPISSIRTLEDEYASMTRKAKEALDRYIRSEDTAGLSIEEKVIEGVPRDAITKFIKEKQIDLMIMVAHEQERFEHLISGREISDLVRKMPCSMLLVRRELEYEHPRT